MHLTNFPVYTYSPFSMGQNENTFFMSVKGEMITRCFRVFHQRPLFNVLSFVFWHTPALRKKSDTRCAKVLMRDMRTLHMWSIRVLKFFASRICCVFCCVFKLYFLPYFLPYFLLSFFAIFIPFLFLPCYFPLRHNREMFSPPTGFYNNFPVLPQIWKN